MENTIAEEAIPQPKAYLKHKWFSPENRGRRAEAIKEWRDRNREHVREYAAVYNKKEHVIAKKKEASKAYYYRTREKQIDRSMEYQRTHSSEHNKRVKRWAELNPEKKKAHSALRLAIVNGDVIRESCSKCGNWKACGHHVDYSKPLEVTWLCRRCHVRLHKGLEDIA